MTRSTCRLQAFLIRAHHTLVLMGSGTGSRSGNSSGSSSGSTSGSNSSPPPPHPKMEAVQPPPVSIAVTLPATTTAVRRSPPMGLLHACNLVQDEKLVVATLASLNSSGDPSNIIKQDLRYIIQTRRKAEGKGELTVDFKTPPKDEQLTSEELEKRARRRELNRLAAKRSREKGQRRKDTLLQEIHALQHRNTELECAMTSLVEERDSLVDTLKGHFPKCHDPVAISRSAQLLAFSHRLAQLLDLAIPHLPAAPVLCDRSYSQVRSVETVVSDCSSSVMGTTDHTPPPSVPPPPPHTPLLAQTPRPSPFSPTHLPSHTPLPAVAGMTPFCQVPSHPHPSPQGADLPSPSSAAPFPLGGRGSAAGVVISQMEPVISLQQPVAGLGAASTSDADDRSEGSDTEHSSTYRSTAATPVIVPPSATSFSELSYPRTTPHHPSFPQSPPLPSPASLLLTPTHPLAQTTHLSSSFSETTASPETAVVSAPFLRTSYQCGRDSHILRCDTEADAEPDQQTTCMTVSAYDRANRCPLSIPLSPLSSSRPSSSFGGSSSNSSISAGFRRVPVQRVASFHGTSLQATEQQLAPLNLSKRRKSEDYGVIEENLIPMYEGARGCPRDLSGLHTWPGPSWIKREPCAREDEDLPLNLVCREQPRTVLSAPPHHSWEEAPLNLIKRESYDFTRDDEDDVTFTSTSRKLTRYSRCDDVS